MKNIKIFLPLLVFYLFSTILFTDNKLAGDEITFIRYATNLSDGYYADKDLNLVCGPGYPLVLLPFVSLKTSLLIPKLLNSLFIIGGLFYIFSFISYYVGEKRAIIIAYFIGVLPIILINFIRLYSEAFAFFLSCGFIYHILQFYNKESKNRSQLILASFFLGFLALTRTIFGFVILTNLAALLVFYFYRKIIIIKKTIFVLIVSLIFCTPYLVYTFLLTGKIYYWSTNAGDTIYWLSTPYPNEFGDWYSTKEVSSTSIMNEGHRNFYQKLDSLNAVEKDKLFMVRAMQNIYSHPFKFVQNWTANMGRLFFNYPYTYDPGINSYDHQKLTTYFYMIPNMFLVVLFVFSIYPAIISRKIIPHQVLIISLIGFIYLAGSTLASALVRYFVEAIPFIVLWLVYIYSQIIKIEIKR